VVNGDCQIKVLAPKYTLHLPDHSLFHQ